MVLLFYRMIERDYAAMDARKENKEVKADLDFSVYNTFEDVSFHRIFCWMVQSEDRCIMWTKYKPRQTIPLNA